MLGLVILGAALGGLAGLGLGLFVSLSPPGGIWPEALAALIFAGAGLGALVPILGGGL